MNEVVLDMLSGPKLTQAVAVRSEPTIRLSHISKYYAGVTALNDVSVAFHSGEVHAVLGENGAGKSTLMKIMSGAVQPDEGEIEFDEKIVSPLDPKSAASLGISISFQHPAILQDLTVMENFRLSGAMLSLESESVASVVRDALDDVGLHVPLNARADTLTVAQTHLLEIAKALAMRPRVLILDEPTAALDKEASDMLFRHIRQVAETGTAVIYITHRLAELRQIAQKVTILRDGCSQGVALVNEVSNQHLLRLIVGRTLDSAFPQKASGPPQEANLEVHGLSGDGFVDVSLQEPRGQIVGISGVEGNGQRELMRALAGIQPSKGEIRLKGRRLDHRELLHQAALMPSDRLKDGLAGSLNVRENATFSALHKFARFGVLSRRQEVVQVEKTLSSLAVKAAGLEAPVLSLSGGNQQKIVMARALLSEPGLIVADEPTQGVDVGARFEIYSILRAVSNAGTAVIVNSSDAAELEGLCDQVVVMSRGRVVATLSGGDVNEAQMIAAAVNADTLGGHKDLPSPGKPVESGLRRFLQTDIAPVVPLALISGLLGLFLFYQNPNFLSAYNIGNVLLLAAALGFISLGQTVAMMVGGIDLSVGPLCGFLVVVASFFINDGQSTVTIFAGFSLMFGVALIVGVFNSALIRYAKFSPIAATLAMYMGLQGFSFLLREGVGGFINTSAVDVINWQVGPIPVAFVILVGLAISGEVALRKTRIGWSLRATGSNEESARRNGVQVDRLFFFAFITVALLTACGAIMLMAQIGVGDPRQGTNYTLASITAVVLGGTSLRGGRGTFLGTVFGAVLLTEILNAVAFQGLSQTYQYVFQGLLVLVSALVYSVVRGRVNN